MPGYIFFTIRVIDARLVNRDTIV